MIWADREAKKLKERNKTLEWVDDMKTPSGRIHVGSLRGVVIHDLVYKCLNEIDVPSKFTYVFNDLDPMDAIPSYLEYSKWQQYEGVPLCNIPSPEKGYDSFAEYYAKEFINTFEKINCRPEIVWSSNLYRSGKMNNVIKEILDQSDKVRDIYMKVAKAHKPNDWFPIQAICENCGKIGTTVVHKWDGKHIFYTCQPHLVKWAKGCGHEGKITPFDGNAKLVWRLDWPAYWKVIGVTIEGSGKDHMSAGGSYDMASAICREVLNTEPPHAVPYEWFTIGGKKMSSSKGVGYSAKDILEILPPEVARFLIVRTPIQTHLDFDPMKPDTVPNLFDDYDRCMNAYFLKIQNKLPTGKKGEVFSDFARIIELSEVKPLPDTPMYLPRFRTIVNMVRAKADVIAHETQQKGSALTAEERSLLEERVVFAEKYIEDLKRNTDIQSHHTSHNIKELPKSEILFLRAFKKRLEEMKEPQAEAIKKALFESIGEVGLSVKQAFNAFYMSVIGASHGPHANELILELGPAEVIQRIDKTIEVSEKKENVFSSIQKFSNPEIFSIDPAVASRYPSISIGIAVIKNVKIQKTFQTLQKEIDEFISGMKNMTNESISALPEVLSYRKLYKEMGIDWHSRRPSPEALLRRISKGKGLYNVNTCVDAYNLVVMKNRVSVGAFDYDKINFPTVLRFPRKGEKILLLGDTEPTEYDEKELAYFDKTGGYNIDFNYRDAQRTAVSESTTNLYLNVDGIYDVTPQKVYQSLKESIEIIQKYCGGIVEKMGLLSV